MKLLCDLTASCPDRTDMSRKQLKYMTIEVYGHINFEIFVLYVSTLRNTSSIV